MIRIADRSVEVAGRRVETALTRTLEPAELAAAIIALEPAKRTSLVLPASWCFIQRVVVPQRRPTHAMLTFALEEYLPVEIERLTCDFLRGSGGSHWGVAVETERVRAILDALAAHGVFIEHICVALPTGDGESAWIDDEHVVLGRITSGMIEELRVVRFTVEDGAWTERVRTELQILGAPRVYGAVAPERLCELPGGVGKEEAPLPAIDLARGELRPADQAERRWRSARSILTASLAAAMILLAALFIAEQRTRSEIDRVSAWERQIFAEALPGERVPSGIALRLASERRRLELLSGTAAGDADSPDALETLRTLIAALPADVLIDVQELRIERENVLLRGLARDHASAEKLSKALHALPGMEATAPRTDRQKDGSVQFFVTASRIKPEGKP